MLQEYLDINAPILKAITSMGSDSATVSDGCRAWLEIKAHSEALKSQDIDTISSCPNIDIQSFKLTTKKRVADGVKDVHYLALFLDVRPSMREFVHKHHKKDLIGDASACTLGSTTAMQAATRAAQAMACAIPVEGKDVSAVSDALTKSFRIFMEVCHGPLDCCCRTH